MNIKSRRNTEDLEDAKIYLTCFYITIILFPNVIQMENRLVSRVKFVRNHQALSFDLYIPASVAAQ